MQALFSISPRIRRAILNMLSDAHVYGAAMIHTLGNRRGFSRLGELLKYIDERYGDDVPEAVSKRLYDLLLQSVEPESVAILMNRQTPLDDLSDALLMVVPDDLFVLAVELAEDQAVSLAFQPGTIIEWREKFETDVTDLLVSNGVPYHFGNGGLVPSISPTASAASIYPAVDALTDERLADARTHFLEALRRLEEPDPEEAVDEARQAVECAMLAVLDAIGTERPAKRQPQDLFDALVPGITRNAEEIVLATPRFRARTRAGHSGGPPVTLGEGQAAVAAAAAAVLYLADKLGP